MRAPNETSKDFSGLFTGRSALLEVRAIGDDLSKGPWVGVIAELLGTDSFGSNSAANPSPSATATSSEINVTWETISGNQGYDLYINETYVASIAANETSYPYSGGAVPVRPDTNYLVELQTKTASGPSERIPVLVKTSP